MSILSAIETIVNGVGTFFDSLPHMWDLAKYFFTDYLPDLISFVIDIILAIPQFIFAVFLNLIIVVLKVIPVPEFISKTGPLLANVGSTVLFFASPFQIGYGISVVISAYVLRFFIRRIPFIG